MWSLLAKHAPFSASSGAEVMSCGARASRRGGSSSRGRGWGEGREPSAGLGTRRSLPPQRAGVEELDCDCSREGLGSQACSAGAFCQESLPGAGEQIVVFRRRVGAGCGFSPCFGLRQRPFRLG